MKAIGKNGTVRINIAPDAMRAELTYEPGEGAALTKKEAAELLANMNVVYGVDEQAVEQALAASEKVTLPVASGRAAVPGKKGSLAFFVDYAAGVAAPKIDWSGTADYRETQTILEIKEGMLIAEKTGPVPGKNGRTVTGKKVPAPPLEEADVKHGAGVYKKENRYYASYSGRLFVEKRGAQYMLDVLKQLVYSGSVNLSSGNLRFQGDIEISGDVESHMRVEAAGAIEVKGQLSKATLIAGHSVFGHRNVFSSIITSGRSGEATKELAEKLAVCLPDVMMLADKLDVLLKEFSRRRQQVEPARAAQMLIETTCPHMPEAVKQFAYDVSKARQAVPAEWADVANKLYRLFSMRSAAGFDLAFLKETVNEAAFLQSFYMSPEKEPKEPAVCVSVPYAINSSIACSQHVHITGQGIFNSTIKAGGTVEVNGCVKGGSVTAGLLVKVKEAGSRSGVKTVFHVKENGRMEFWKVYPEVTVQFGLRTYAFSKEEGPLGLFVGESGRIEKTGLPRG